MEAFEVKAGIEAVFCETMEDASISSAEKTSMANWHVTVTKGEDGYYVVNVPALRGCMTQGNTVEEALVNAKEAIALWIEDAQAHNEEIPQDEPFTVHVVEVE